MDTSTVYNYIMYLSDILKYAFHGTILGKKFMADFLGIHIITITTNHTNVLTSLSCL